MFRRRIPEIKVVISTEDKEIQGLVDRASCLIDELRQLVQVLYPEENRNAGGEGRELHS